MKTAIVAGATGLVGKQLMYKLLENDNYQKVYALVRKLYEIKHEKLIQILVNYDNLDLISSDVCPTDVFCCLGTTIAKAGSEEAFYKVDFTYIQQIAKFFKKRGAINFLLISAVGAHADSSIFYSRIKGETEQAIRQLDYEGLHFFRPSLLLGQREEMRIGERVGIGFAMLFQPFMFGGLEKYKPIHAASLADYMILRSLESKKGVFIRENPDF